MPKTDKSNPDCLDPASWRLDAPPSAKNSAAAPKAKDWRRHKRDDRRAMRLGNGPPDFAYMPREVHVKLRWAETATDYRIAWYVLGKFTMNGEQPFPLGNAVLREWNVTPKMKMRALKAHRDHDSLTFTEGERKAPQVTPLASFWGEFLRKDKP